MKNTRSPQLAWESLQATCMTLEEGECIYLKQEQFPLVGVVFRDTEADKELWEARVLANGTCFFARCPSEAQAKKYVEKRMRLTLKAFEEVVAVPTPYEKRSTIQDMLVFLLASTEAHEQIVEMTEYENPYVWVALCYNSRTGLLQNYVMRYDTEGVPFIMNAQDFSGQYTDTFRARAGGRKRMHTCKKGVS